MKKLLLGEEYPLNILLAEDNKVNQVLTLGLLSCLGYRCDLAENGKLAIEASEKTFYDLILMDCQLPLLDGFEAAAAIRKRRPGLPIIAAYSASVTAIHKERFQESGMQFVLSKPVSLEALSNLTRKVYDLIHPQNSHEPQFNPSTP